MNTQALHFALREMRGYFRQPAALGILIALSFILGIAGPFGTIDFMRLFPRIAYWTVMTYLTFGVGVFVHALFEQRTAPSKSRNWRNVALASCFTGLAVALVVFAVNWVALGVVPDDPKYLLTTGSNALAIAVIISVAMAFHHFAQTGTGRSVPKDQPKILNRLDPNKRGKLVSLSVQDHYVEVSTTQGASLVLMRLADAIGETEGAVGLQVHRSHWVATDAVKIGVRTGDRALLTMNDGREIPVSRTYLKTVKEAGLLDENGMQRRND